jgi:hypothetical protein
LLGHGTHATKGYVISSGLSGQRIFLHGRIQLSHWEDTLFISVIAQAAGSHLKEDTLQLCGNFLNFESAHWMRADEPDATTR